MKILGSAVSKNDMIRMITAEKPMTKSEIKTQFSLRSVATGNGTATALGYVSVTGLSFQPKVIIMEQYYGSDYKRAVYWLDTQNGSYHSYSMRSDSAGYTLQSGWAIAGNGFSMSMFNFGYAPTYKWIAFD